MLSAAGMAPKAAVADDETVGTHLPTTQPEWVSELLSLAKKDFGKVSSEEFGAVLKKVESGGGGDRFFCSVPLGVMDFAQMAIRGCWPLKGVVQKAKAHWYENRTQGFAFPPSGQMLHLAFYGKSLLISDSGKLQRENCDVLFLAWMLRYKEALDKKDLATMAQMQADAKQCACTLHRRETENDKLAAAYQLVEDEEKAATIMGHSILTRARELNGLQDTHAWLNNSCVIDFCMFFNHVLFIGKPM